MEKGFLNIACQIQDLALKELDENRVLEAYSLLEMAFTTAFMAKSTIPLSFKLRPRAILPRSIESVEHVIVHVSRQNIVLFAAADIVSRPLCSFERFPMVGDIFSNIAKKLPENGVFECIFDLGDGTDSGRYRRVAYSSAQADTILIPDPYFYENDNYDVYRAHVARHAKPWRDRKNVIFWRGGSAGPRIKEADPRDPSSWDCQQRLQLCASARKSSHAAMLDVALVSLRTIAEPYLRQAIEHEGWLKPEVPKLAFLDYRYLVDVDGWTNAWSLLDKMIGGATILKVESAFGFRQWFYDKLIPWENFIPLAADLSDLDETVAWIIAHPEDCERIAANAASLGAQVNLLPDLAVAEERIMSILEPVGNIQ